MITKKFLKTKDVCEVTFEYANENSAEVALVGDFNDWQPVAMKQAKKAGSPYYAKIPSK